MNVMFQFEFVIFLDLLGSGPMVICTSTPQSSELPSSDVIILEGHTSEV